MFSHYNLSGNWEVGCHHNYATIDMRPQLATSKRSHIAVTKIQEIGQINGGDSSLTLPGVGWWAGYETELTLIKIVISSNLLHT